MTKVVIGAQYASGSRNSRATSTEPTAATAVRAECTTTGNAARSTAPHPNLLVIGKTPPSASSYSRIGPTKLNRRAN